MKNFDDLKDVLLALMLFFWMAIGIVCVIGTIAVSLMGINDMFTKKDHNIRIVLREQLDDFLPNGVGLAISDSIEQDVIDEITANGRHPDKFDGAEVREAIGKALRARVVEVSGE